MSAKCCRKAIYFLSLEIENVRCFAEKQVLDLAASNNRPARWTLLVGDNGVGKNDPPAMSIMDASGAILSTRGWADRYPTMSVRSGYSRHGEVVP